MSFKAVIGSLDVTAYETSGVQWSTEIMGGLGSTGSSISPVSKPRQSGSWAGDAFSSARHIVLSGLIQAPTQDLLIDAKNRLIDASSLATTSLIVTEAASTWTSFVRRNDEVIFTYVTDVVAIWSVQFVALDPRKFGATLTGSTLLPMTSGGLTVPFTVPFAINSTVVSGQVALTNPGNTTGPVIIRIDGPVTAPIVTHRGPSGVPLVYSSSLVLAAGEWLMVDMDARTALGNGQASRAGYTTSRGWFGFDPGVNVFAFSSPVYNAASSMTVFATPSWK